MKSDYRIRAERFIAEIYPYICEFPTNRMYYRKAIARFNREHHNRRVECSNGAVRIALITSDYVVKFNYDEDEAHEYGGCEDEVNFYQFAKEMGFQHLFAEVTPFVYKGHMFCIMPRINGIGSCPYDEAFAHMSKEECAFCKRHHLTDLHGQNYGFREGHVCIIDYACRYSWSSEYSSEYSA